MELRRRLVLRRRLIDADDTHAHNAVAEQEIAEPVYVPGSGEPPPLRPPF